VAQGQAASPTATINAPSEVWLKIARKELDGAAAFMSGQFKATGDLGLLMRMGSLFQ
jgi:putative sterol carrier protein